MGKPYRDAPPKYSGSYHEAICAHLGSWRPGFQTDDWQGVWVVRVEPDRYLWGYFGSCSYCDSFLHWWDGQEPAVEVSEYGKRLLAEGAMDASAMLAKMDKYDAAQVKTWLEEQ